jgi:hypothetical protein
MKDVVTSLVYTPVPKAFVEAIWDDVIRVLKPAVDTTRGKYDIDGLYEGIMPT